MCLVLCTNLEYVQCAVQYSRKNMVAPKFLHAAHPPFNAVRSLPPFPSPPSPPIAAVAGANHRRQFAPLFAVSSRILLPAAALLLADSIGLCQRCGAPPGGGYSVKQFCAFHYWNLASICSFHSAREIILPQAASTLSKPINISICCWGQARRGRQWGLGARGRRPAKPGEADRRVLPHTGRDPSRA